MTVSVRSVLLLFSTLLLGVVIGAAGLRAADRFLPPSRDGYGGGPPRRDGGGGPPDRRGPRPREEERPDGSSGRFVSHMMRTINARDPVQEAQVRAIVEATAATNRREIDAANRALEAAVDSMQRTLAPMLDEGQRARLADEARRLPMVRPARP